MDLIEFGGILVGAGTFLGSGAAWYQARINGKQMRTNHGKRPGEYLELIAGQVNDMHGDIKDLSTRVDRIEGVIHADGALTRKNTADRAAEIRADHPVE